MVPGGMVVTGSHGGNTGAAVCISRAVGKSKNRGETRMQTIVNAFGTLGTAGTAVNVAANIAVNVVENVEKFVENATKSLVKVCPEPRRPRWVGLSLGAGGEFFWGITNRKY